MMCLVLFREEFNLNLFNFSRKQQPTKYDEDGYAKTKTAIETNYNIDAISNIWEQTLSIAKATFASKSGRAILAAQIGQGALLYSIASWGPLYLERIDAVPSTSSTTDAASPALSSTAALPISATAAAASVAASSLILPQITQALVGAGIGAAADGLSSTIGTQNTRRALQVMSGVIPAVVLWYLSQLGAGISAETNTIGSSNLDWLTPAFLFGTAQTISALSLGAVSVSHLDVASPKSAGAVYALGNVAAAASGSFVVNLFGRLLEDGGGVSSPADDVPRHIVAVGGAAGEFALPFQIVALLSAVGSLYYGCTVETEMEIGLNENDAGRKQR